MSSIVSSFSHFMNFLFQCSIQQGKVCCNQRKQDYCTYNIAAFHSLACGDQPESRALVQPANRSAYRLDPDLLSHRWFLVKSLSRLGKYCSWIVETVWSGSGYWTYSLGKETFWPAGQGLPLGLSPGSCVLLLS